VRACTNLRTTLGAQTFALTFGKTTSSSAFGICISRFTPTGNRGVVGQDSVRGEEGKDVRHMRPDPKRHEGEQAHHELQERRRDLQVTAALARRRHLRGGAVAFTREYKVNPGGLKPLGDRTLVVQGLTVRGPTIRPLRSPAVRSRPDRTADVSHERGGLGPPLSS